MPPTPPAGPDTSGLVGHWFFSGDRDRWELVLRREAGLLTGTLSAEGAVGGPSLLERTSWDPATGQLRFRVEDNDRTFWYAIDVTDGVMTGRYAVTVDSRVAPESWSDYSGHLMGWRSESFDQDLVPRVFDIHISDGRYVRVRIDRTPANGLTAEFTGELKTRGTDSLGAGGELPTQLLLVKRWDGKQIVFDMPNGSSRQRFSGTVRGRTIEGTTVEESTGAVSQFAGTRSDILTYGLRVKTPEARMEWQERVRRMLMRLMMAGNPAPIATESTTTQMPLFPSGEPFAGRDDDSANWQRNYRLTDVVLNHRLPNPYGTEPLQRRAHGVLAVPTTPPPPGGYPIVLSLNGHAGSALGQFQPGNYAWYGEAFARRGYVVFALDISHRPPSEVSYIYNDPVDGDDPENGNHAHPSIAAPGMDGDFVEDGERAWDAMRGIDFLVTQHNVNPAKIIVTGLSMGGTLTEIVSALDPRVTISIPAGASPDNSVLIFQPAHTCWFWTNGNVLEFVDMSDYLALVAPRPLILESGKWDFIYSKLATPFAVEKENAWRARIAYGDDAANMMHYLHNGGHDYRVGDASGERTDPEYIQVPQLIAPPRIRNRPADWEVDGQTVSLNQTLFDYIAR